MLAVVIMVHVAIRRVIVVMYESYVVPSIQHIIHRNELVCNVLLFLRYVAALQYHTTISLAPISRNVPFYFAYNVTFQDVLFLLIYSES